MEKKVDGPNQDSIIEGLVKFRDGKKWKSRWCVIKKLSPVADCIHLQLYRDAKDHAKGGLPKGSLSLRHYLGCESGFTLDKESHTLALLCRGGGGAVLALGAPEALVAWRTRAARALAAGASSRWPGMLVGPPPGSGVKAGPVAVHVRPARFCIVSGMPPKVLAVWDIADLRRYGVVDGGVCFEAGSRSGKLGGAWLIRTDRPHALVAALDAAAPAPNKAASEDTQSLINRRFSEISESSKNISNVSFAPGWNMYSSDQQADTASTVGFNDSASISEVNSSDREQRAVSRHMYAGKCVSCMSHLSSPTSPLGNNSFSGWNTESAMDRRSESDRASLYSQSSGGTSDYSIPRGACANEGSVLNKSASMCGFPPNLRPKSLCPCRHSQKMFAGPYENYDVPRPPMPLIHEYPKMAVVSNAESNYDKPKNLKKCLLKNNCNCKTASTNSEAGAKKTVALLNETIKGNATSDAKVNCDNSISSTNHPTPDCHSNYVNIEPIDNKINHQSEESSKGLSDLTVTLEKYESSAEILRNAGFSQDEIDELENMAEKEIALDPCDKIISETKIEKELGGYLLMQPVDGKIPYRSPSALGGEIEHSQKIINESKNLSKRKSSSADFLQKAEEFFDISKSNSHKDVSVNLNPLRKNLRYECVNDNCVSCVKIPQDTKLCVPQNVIEKVLKPENSLLTKIRDSVKIRRSCSVPSKTIKNRDSSSSNDSGVSTGSSKHHRCDFTDFEITPRYPCGRHNIYSNPINRKATSDTMQHISFQFDGDFNLPKSHSCDTGSTTTQGGKTDTRAFSNNDAQNLRSASSCSSEVSDYLDTLSVSSISSSEVCSRSTARPRSGREYSSIQSALRLHNMCHCCSSAQIL